MTLADTIEAGCGTFCQRPGVSRYQRPDTAVSARRSLPKAIHRDIKYHVILQLGVDRVEQGTDWLPGSSVAYVGKCPGVNDAGHLVLPIHVTVEASMEKPLSAALTVRAEVDTLLNSRYVRALSNAFSVSPGTLPPYTAPIAARTTLGDIYGIRAA